MDQKTLEALLAEWQKTLRLQDWDVIVQLTRIYDIDLEDELGRCTWSLPSKMATIKVLDPADYDPAYTHPFDPEKTLVHELLHLHFAPFFPSEGEGDNVAQEQAIELIAKALVALKRNGTEKGEEMNLLLSKDGWLVVCITFGSSWAQVKHFESRETADEFAAYVKRFDGRVLKMCSVDEFCPTLKTELP